MPEATFGVLPRKGGNFGGKAIIQMDESTKDGMWSRIKWERHQDYILFQVTEERGCSGRPNNNLEQIATE